MTPEGSTGYEFTWEARRVFLKLRSTVLAVIFSSQGRNGGQQLLSVFVI